MTALFQAQRGKGTCLWRRGQNQVEIPDFALIIDQISRSGSQKLALLRQKLKIG